MGERSLPELYEELKDRRRHGESPEATLASLAPLIDELALVARRDGLNTLSFILQLAALEAQKQGKRFDRDQQPQQKREEFARHLEIHALAHRVFGNPRKADAWLSRPNPALDGQVPSELLTDDLGAAVVRDTLQQIDHGIFA